MAFNPEATSHGFVLTLAAVPTESPGFRYWHSMWFAISVFRTGTRVFWSIHGSYHHSD